MSIALEQFVKHLEESGILAGDTIKDFIPPKASPKDSQELARELVRKKKLTAFQAEEAYNGKATSLVLGNYVLMEKIGAGGMGQVFRAEHRRMKRIVAIKLLPTAMTSDSSSIARFEREVEAAAKISHPNIVAAFDADCANGVHFLVMELVEGNDLSVLVKKDGPFSVGNALNCLLQAARGLESAHRKGIVHRDIKPANLLQDKEGTVKILDMGLARLSDDLDATFQSGLTSTGTIMGTVDYMAPEQALDSKTADARADLYALGCSLHYLLTGRAVYEGDTLMKKLLAHRDHPIPSLRAIRPEVTDQLEAVFTKMVAKKTEDRYQTAGELLIDLEKCCLEVGQSVSSHQSLGSHGYTSPEKSTADVFGDANKIDLSDQQTVISNHMLDVPSLTSTELTLLPLENRIGVQAEAVTKRIAKPPSARNPSKWIMIGAGLFGLIFCVAGLLVKIKTKDGTLIVTVNESDSEVQVLNDEGKVEITRKGETGPITIAVDPGKHRLKVTKDGFTVFGQDFEIEEGGKQPITARLVPLEKKSDMEESTPAVADSGGSKLAFHALWFVDWAKDVAAMPADRQVEAVSKKLVDLNPEFDGKVTHQIGDGVVQELAFSTDHVTDISPVRALPGLKSLNCAGTLATNSGILSELSPLAGMKLSVLNIQATQVADLSPLQGMPLTHLLCTYSKISDLSPLKGHSLTHLQIENTSVRDLTSLAGMPLKSLQFDGTDVSNLSPLREMTFTVLGFHRTLVTDLSPLKETSVQNLHLDFAADWDVAILRSIGTLETINEKPATEFFVKLDTYKAEAERPLAIDSPDFELWMKETSGRPAEEQLRAVIEKLQQLNPGFDGTMIPTIDSGIVTGLQFSADHVSDISPVRALEGLSQLSIHGSMDGAGKLISLKPLTGLQLRSLHIFSTKVRDLSPLREMKLTSLHCSGTLVSDCSPLKGMPLEFLDVSKTRVHDLSPLTGAPLNELWIFDSLVSDLTPLKGMSLKILSGASYHLNDFSVIKDMPLRYLGLVFDPQRHTDLLRSIKTLNTVNDKPIAEFWKEVEATKP